MIHVDLYAFKPVDEDWCGNYRIANDRRYENTMFVKVAFSGPVEPHKMYVCNVWGNDDLGMEIWSTDFSKLKKIYLQIFLTKKNNTNRFA